jgi:hypothetical protein
MVSPQQPWAQTPADKEAALALPLAPQRAAAPLSAAKDRPDRGSHWLTFLVLVLAFLSASFVARNSDLWFHLATGRLVAEGELAFGADPFAYTTSSVYWVCHAWLFDLALYEMYGLVGGAGLVVLKALLVTALAWLLMQVRRPGGTSWLPAFCTTLAVVAISPRLLLQPTCVSYFLLGLTFWLLWLPHTHKDERRRIKKESSKSRLILHPSSFILPLVFALWVNVDEWFFLGPLLAGLFWLGERLWGQRQTPGWVVIAGVAACFFNPHTFHAFTLPPELSVVPWTAGLRQDLRFQALFATPWQPSYLYAPIGVSAAAIAYFALTALGLVSFLLQPHALRGWRLIVWLPFAVLAAWQARAIPFFAVVAAPITALNWQDILGTRDTAWRRKRFVVVRPSSLVLTVGLLGLVALTVPGWLAGSPRGGRHVAWDVEPDPSLQQAAETLHHWRSQGLLAPGERVFGLSPEVAQYGAWFCPGETHFFDHRFGLFPGVAQDYETVSRALLPGLVRAGTEGEPASDWRQVLRERRVGIVVFYDREPQRLFAVLRRLAADPAQWTLLHVAGQALIVGWNEARPAGAFRAVAFDADRLAFGPEGPSAGARLPAAPTQGPAMLPPRRDWWERLVRQPAAPTWESAAATMYLHYFDDSEAGQRRRQLRTAVAGYAASLAGLPAVPLAWPQMSFQLVASQHVLFPPRGAPTFVVRDQLGPFYGSLVERPPALPLLAVRAARRAVAVNPEDSNAWLRLGQAYLSLRNLTRERSAEGMVPPLAQLRHVQIVTALEQAVRLDPDLEAVHHELALLYGERNYLDQSLEHRREEVRLSRRAGTRPGEKPEEAADRLELLEKDSAKLEELVRARRQTYASAVRSVQGERLAQAGLALKLGLARLAADEVLLPTPADVLGAPGLKVELEVLLALGRVEEVRPYLNDDSLKTRKLGLGFYDVVGPRDREGRPLYPLPYHLPGYDWLHVLQAAAVGDYGRAQETLRSIRAGHRAGHVLLRRQLQDLERYATPQVAGLLAAPPPFLPAFTAGTLGQLLEHRDQLRAGEPAMRAQEADLCVLEGLLALEQGSPQEAGLAFAEAQRLCAQAPAMAFAGGPIAAAYLARLHSAE